MSTTPDDHVILGPETVFNLAIAREAIAEARKRFQADRGALLASRDPRRDAGILASLVDISVEAMLYRYRKVTCDRCREDIAAIARRAVESALLDPARQGEQAG